MFRWTLELAGRELYDLIGEIPFLSNEHAFSTKHTKWVTHTLTYLEQVFGPNSSRLLKNGLNRRFLS